MRTNRRPSNVVTGMIIKAMPLSKALAPVLISLLGGLLAAILLVGCSEILPKPPGRPPTTYLLAPDLPTHASGSGRSARTSPLLLVAQPEAAPGYTTRRMAYLERDYRLDYFADHEWVDTPAAMLAPLLVRALREWAAFDHVSEEASGIYGGLRLDTTIESLYQDFRTRPSRVQVSLQARLVDPGGGHILAIRVFGDSEPTPADDPYGGVVAANRVLARLLPRLADFAAEVARRPAPPAANRTDRAAPGPAVQSPHPRVTEGTERGPHRHR